MLEHLLAQPEGKTLEFKLDSTAPTLLMKTLVAFANTAGGRLIIGVASDRQIVGLKAPLDEEERLRSLIADLITPNLVPDIELVTIHETTVLVIKLSVSALRPHWLKAEGQEHGVYVRIGASTIPADATLIAELARQAEGISHDEMPMPELSKDDLDLSAVQKCFAADWRLDEQALVTIKLLTSYQRRLVPTKGAVLLFGKERALHFSDAWIQCGRFTGSDRAIIFDSLDINEHLPLAVTSCMAFLEKYVPQDALLVLPILKEVVINALLHADYSLRGAPIRIAFFDDRIETENPGMLLPGMTIDDMKQGTSRIRNHVIARLFRELNLVERWGSGMHSIFRESAELGLPEPQIMEVGMRIRVVVYLARPVHLFTEKAQERAQVKREEEAQVEAIERAQVRVQVKAQDEVQVSGGVDVQVLSLCVHKPLSSAEIAFALGHKQLSGNLRKALPRLRDSGLLAYTIPEKPNSRSQKYRLTAKGKALLVSRSRGAGRN